MLLLIAALTGYGASAREWQWYWNSFRNIQNILLPPEGVHQLWYSTSVMLPCRDPPGRFARRYSTSVMPSCCHAVTLLAVCSKVLNFCHAVMLSCRDPPGRVCSKVLNFRHAVMLSCRDPPGRFALRYSTSVMPSCRDPPGRFALRYSTGSVLSFSNKLL